MANNNHSCNKIHLVIICLALMCQYKICQVNAIACGTKNVTIPLVQDGNKIVRGEWPFLVAIYNTSKYLCGGTLISNKHVLTAAHCIQEKYSPIKLSPNDIEVHIGAYNLTAKNETGVVKSIITEIYVHPEWEVYDNIYDADIAILVLSANISFTNYIRPVCMPGDDDIIDAATINVEGHIVGWGLAESNKHEDIARQAVTKALNNSYCYRRDLSIVVITSERMFCGGDSEENPNIGDSGGGFFVFSDTAWVQHGIISAIRTNAAGQITVNSLTIYTNVGKFKKWIVETVRRLGSKVGEKTKLSQMINLTCIYDYSANYESSYTCALDKLDIRTKNVDVVSIIGTHLRRRHDKDVVTVAFERGTMFYLPDGLGKLFKNVTKVQIAPSLRTKLVKRSNFKNMENLQKLQIFENDIEILDEDVLWELPNLNHFQLSNNKLKVLNEKTFERNLKLMNVGLFSNQIEVLPANLFQNNLLLQQVRFDGNLIKTIDEKIFINNAKLSGVDLSKNQLEFIPQNLFQENVFLTSTSFSNNSLKGLDEETFVNNVNLKEIGLDGNQLEFLPVNLFRNNSLLQIVNLLDNYLKEIDETFFVNNPKLTHVDLSKNRLEFIRNLFKKNVFLTFASFSNNFLKGLDEETFTNNVYLKNIWLNANQLEYLPVNLFRNNSLLDSVDLSENRLEVIPQNLFQKNVFLTLAAFINNSLKGLDEETFTNNVYLKNIWLNANQLEFLPVNLFRNNSLLESVDLHDIYLKEIDETFFIHNQNLVAVNLSFNHLDILPKNLFKKNVMIQSVTFHSNNLKIINEETFFNNPRLKNVYLNSNKIEFLHRNLFRNNLLLEKVDFSDNEIKVIEIDFTEMQNIKYVIIYDNVCMNGFYGIYQDPDEKNPEEYYGAFKSLTEFQDVIRANCSSSNPQRDL